MKLNLRLISFAFAAVGLFVATSAKADTASFSVWENGITNLEPLPEPGSTLPYTNTPDVTGTVTNSNPLSLFSFTSGTDLSLDAFLTAGGDTTTYTTGLSNSTASINQSVFEFTGTQDIAAGDYTFTKDDSLILVVNGVECIDAPTATAAETVTCHVASSGVQSYQLYYDETNGPPAVLTGNLGPTPEPSSFVLLGSSLLGAAGMLRRRMKNS
ncbi:MAG TPA: PEP-CTERM sorting domain-containing protein [Acidobacteriaceae bacterium]|jgi:hypothetical protein